MLVSFIAPNAKAQGKLESFFASPRLGVKMSSQLCNNPKLTKDADVFPEDCYAGQLR